MHDTICKRQLILYQNTIKESNINKIIVIIDNKT